MCRVLLRKEARHDPEQRPISRGHRRGSYELAGLPSGRQRQRHDQAAARRRASLAPAPGRSPRMGTHMSREVRRLALDLTWTWEPRIQRLFQALEPGIWDETSHNPMAVLRALGDAGVEQ